MILNKTIKIGALFTALILMLTGCSINNKTLEKSQKNEDVLVTLILDKGGVNDGSFNESAWSGAERASKELGIEVKYLESNTDADYVQNIETAIDLESDLIIGVGFNLSKAIEDAAKSYPKQQFAIVDGSFEEIPSNVTPIVFDEIVGVVEFSTGNLEKWVVFTASVKSIVAKMFHKQQSMIRPEIGYHVFQAVGDVTTVQ